MLGRAEDLLSVFRLYSELQTEAAEVMESRSEPLRPIAAWRRGKLEKSSHCWLSGRRIDYEFHGSGCWVSLDGVAVELEFDDEGELLHGADPWRLHCFIRDNDEVVLPQFGSAQEIAGALEELEGAGLVARDVSRGEEAKWFRHPLGR